MKKSEILNLVNDISNKFSNINPQADVELQCEVLHASILAIYNDFTQEEYKGLPLMLKKTLEKLDASILKCVSVEYKQDVENEYRKQTIFLKERPKQDVKVSTKIKTNIGFLKEEGTTI